MGKKSHFPSLADFPRSRNDGKKSPWPLSPGILKENCQSWDLIGSYWAQIRLIFLSFSLPSSLSFFLVWHLGPCCLSHGWIMVCRFLQRAKHCPWSLPFICKWTNPKAKSPNLAAFFTAALTLLRHSSPALTTPGLGIRGPLYPRPVKLFKLANPNLVHLLKLPFPSLALKTSIKAFLQFPRTLSALLWP